MNNLKIILDLKETLAKMFENENTGHDISHLERVLESALEIQKHEGGDLYIIAVSALVHDIHRLMSTEQGVYITPEDSLGVTEKLLKSCNVDKSKIKPILDVVKNHENKANKNQTLETLIVQDADALDAMGEIGLNRSLKYCKTNNIPVTNFDFPLDCKEYIPDINPISTCHYVYRTMIPNAKKLYTATARKLAADKVKVLETFINKHYKDKKF